jgi:hypothetical protein
LEGGDPFLPRVVGVIGWDAPGEFQQHHSVGEREDGPGAPATGGPLQRCGGAVLDGRRVGARGKRLVGHQPVQVRVGARERPLVGCQATLRRFSRIRMRESR